MTLAPATKAPVASFPVVCLGGSAGGLSAYQEILRELPADFSMAIVIVAHRSKENSMYLVPLLAKVTTMKVVEAKEGMRLEPNHVYVTPPQKAITTDGMVLKLKAVKTFSLFSTALLHYPAFSLIIANCLPISLAVSTKSTFPVLTAACGMLSQLASDCANVIPPASLIAANAMLPS
jgi:CheB methylesterase